MALAKVIVYLSPCHASIGVISAQTSSSGFVIIDVEFGVYTMEVSLMSNGTILPNSTYETTIQVISKPIGDVFSVFITLIVIMIIMLSIISIPTVVEHIRK